MVMDMIIKIYFHRCCSQVYLFASNFILKLTTKISSSSFTHVVCSDLLAQDSSYMNSFHHSTDNNEIYFLFIIRCCLLDLNCLQILFDIGFVCLLKVEWSNSMVQTTSTKL
jgi:hypothetical protein